MTKKPRVGGHEIKNLPIPVNRCFACGQDNKEGMHLKFRFDEARRRVDCRFRLTERYQGPPGHAHGGIVATILDEAMGKVNKLRSVIALTKHMEVEYVRPVPLGKMLLVEGHEQSVHGRKHINIAEIRNPKNEVLARGRALFIAIDPLKMFAKHIKKDVK